MTMSLDDSAWLWESQSTRCGPLLAAHGKSSSGQNRLIEFKVFTSLKLALSRCFCHGLLGEATARAGGDGISAA